MSQDLSLEINRPLQSTRAAVISFVAILVGHTTVDILAALVPTTLGLLEARLGLTAQQSAWLFGMGPFFSGVSQPLCGLASDRFATRQLAVVGLALSALGIGSLGLASDYFSLISVYMLGVIGIGMFHPVGVATIGHLGKARRTSAVSSFFVAGMLGGVLGSIVWPRLLSSPERFGMLPLIVLPILALALVLQRSFAGLEPLQVHKSRTTATEHPPIEWKLVGLLYLASALRFCVNTALAYLFLRWIQSGVAAAHPSWTLEQIATSAAPQVGNLNAAMLVGMAAGGLLAGMLIRPGKEKWPLVLVPLCFAPVIAMFPFLPVQAGYLLAVAAGIGFAGVIPVSIAMAQHLMPGRTNLASSLMMGGAWAVAMLGPTCAEFGVARFGLRTTFLTTAITLAVAGIVCLPIKDQQ